MIEFALQNPWSKPRRSWFYRYQWIEWTQARLVVISSLIVLVVAVLAVWTAVRSFQVRDADARISSLMEDTDQLNQRLQWSREYSRIFLALHDVAKKNMTASQKVRLAESLWMLSRDYRFDPLVVLAVMHVESRSNPAARGRYMSGAESGALGLMQVKLPTAQLMAKDLGIVVQSESDLMKPEVNMLLGTYYLMRLVVRTGSFHRALMAYNIGPAGLERALAGEGKLPRGYVEKTLKEYSKLRIKYGEMPQ